MLRSELRGRVSFAFKGRFLLLFLSMAILSVLWHEWGHCLFYWVQGIPAAFSLTKEFPLRDITEHQYAIGAAGGPLMSLLLFVGSYLLILRSRYVGRKLTMLDAVFLATNCYLVLRALVALLKHQGGELDDAASLVGLGYRSVALLFLVLASVGLSLWMRKREIPFRARKVGAYLGLFLAFSVLVVGLAELDRTLLWSKFPTVRIEGRGWYNPSPATPPTAKP